MREIKFRAWDTNMSKMYSMKQLLLRWNALSILKCPYFNIMQYTGLKDKNGTEIYEGDIVKCDYFTGVVEYREIAGIYVIGNKELEKCITFFDIHMGKGKVEVIGNIYENPELLEGEE